MENACTFLLRKEKAWKCILNNNSALLQNRTQKNIMPSKTTINWLLNDTCYLFIVCFDWKVGVFQKTVVRVYYVLKSICWILFLKIFLVIYFLWMLYFIPAIYLQWFNIWNFFWVPLNFSIIQCSCCCLLKTIIIFIFGFIAVFFFFIQPGESMYEPPCLILILWYL